MLNSIGRVKHRSNNGIVTKVLLDRFETDRPIETHETFYPRRASGYSVWSNPEQNHYLSVRKLNPREEFWRNIVRV